MVSVVKTKAWFILLRRVDATPFNNLHSFVPELTRAVQFYAKKNSQNNHSIRFLFSILASRVLVLNNSDSRERECVLLLLELKVM